jgi:ribosomal protein L32
MENLTALTCPNCGAAATNHKNCEYCGSLLVRFVDKGIELAQTDYTSNIKVLPGLIAALKQNLEIQKENPAAAVATDVIREVSVLKAGIGGSSILASVINNLLTNDGKVFFPEVDMNDGKPHLMVAFAFDKHLLVDKQTHNKFKKLRSFELFTCYDKGCYEYAIDFGEDIEGAARILSEVLHEVYSVGYGTRLDYKTTYGEGNIDEEREKNKPWYERYIWWLVAGGFILFNLIRFACSD